MASVTSLGLHQPTALDYAIQEQLLPENPDPSLYEWDITVDHTTTDEAEDELLVTKHTVIWSRGCIFRKCFGFQLEKEPITQAVLTYFPLSEDPVNPKGGSSTKHHEDSTLSRALVVFLQTQAHIYFLDGTSHVVHMPFEVESACAAPQGVIVQRKYRADAAAAASLKFPRVPPNSFISNQTSPVATRTSQLSTFSVEALGKPKALPLRLSSHADNMWGVPEDKTDSHWPRLVALTDPLLELGLVVTQPERSAKTRPQKRSDKTPHFLDRAEEILHIEEVARSAQSAGTGDNRLILAVTANRDTSMYTVWKLTYLRNGDPFRSVRRSQKRHSGPRRSSMQPGLSGPAPNPHQPSTKDNFGAPLPGKRSRKSEKVEKTDRALEKLESSLGLDKESGVTRRTSRRVSSMLARADLSASQDRTGFAEQPQIPSHAGGRRDTSHGSQRSRTSGVFSGPGYGAPHTHGANSLSNFLEAPVDTLLEELRAGGDFEGFHSMGLDDHDFDGLSQEILFTKIHSIPIDNTNVRYSLSKQPARRQSKVFCVAGPCMTADHFTRQEVLVGLQDPMENRLQLLTLHVQFKGKPPPGKTDQHKLTITFGQLKKANNVIDSCKIADRKTSMILMLSQAQDGKRQLSVQAPWSPFSPVTLPDKLCLANLRNIAYRGSLVNREVGIRRAITPVIGEIAGMRHAKLRGVVDILDGSDMSLHQIQVQLEPRSAWVRKIMDMLRSILPNTSTDHLLVGWWDIISWLHDQEIKAINVEWHAAMIQILLLYLGSGFHLKPTGLDQTPPRKARSLLRSSSGAVIDLADWYTMGDLETPGSMIHPFWMEKRPWQWILEEHDAPDTLFQSNPRAAEVNSLPSLLSNAIAYLGSRGSAPLDYLPRGASENGTNRYPDDILFGLHLLLEEQKLNIASVTSGSPEVTDLRGILLHIAKWMNWPKWVQSYQLELPFDWPDQSVKVVELSTSTLSISREPDYWSVFEWAQTNLSSHSGLRRHLPVVSKSIATSNLPRIRMLDELFQKLESRRSPPDFVVAMYQSGIAPTVLETLPESILIPLRDAITQCQPNPPSTWSQDMLELVDRADAQLMLSSGKKYRNYATGPNAPTHHASWDFSSLCQNVMEFNDMPADDVAESEKQAVIRAIFREDRRLDETKLMLNTARPRAVRLDPLPEWSQPFYLEQQKELVTRLATNTLSIPAGRGLMNYGLRFPLLTQKFQIHGFVLNCTVKPNNVTVGVDKSLFTEEKIAWSFFHSGVAAGLSISPEAKGIDTSWILYNKPGNDLNNRHAGFLLALGLNGHLKDVAKWVAFKYLTPKHTMTSIGLLLGLAASYIGTMDSLITRLLSVHVTRMLPRGAAELNLSPLTQTTGIMGIGLLYCNSQHRRMSEIMMSEIAHMDTEEDIETLRTECYRLAAGFALGFINLGKGTDLKGLHDMRVTEKLLTLATATKKVEEIHILDRSNAAAVAAIALIYLKSEDNVVARKIDVPDAVLQFDYIRPDILLLRTATKHLILWSSIKPTHDWIRDNLPSRYHYRVHSPSQPFNSSSRGPLNSTHLPFLSILAGLCFAMALRYAGSGNTQVRDLLLSYLHRFHAQCRNPKPDASFDDRSVQVTARMCLDVVAISCAIVMAGTCDLKVLRILRSLHGRNDAETTYGSHMATHMAIGVLSLGCGTQTFSTSNLAIASLLVAFYPVFPDSVQDNKCHLQAFRHFWVLATDPRCLVAKDVATNAPISVPISIRLKKSSNSTLPDEYRMTPCLLPPLNEITSLRTTSPDFWNLELDFAAHPEYTEAFKYTQALYLRRRPMNDSPFSATMSALGREDRTLNFGAAESSSQPLEWLFNNVPSLQRLTYAERGLVLDHAVGSPDVGDASGSVVDSRLVIEEDVRNGSRDDLVEVKGLFEWVEWRAQQGQRAEKSKGHKDNTNDALKSVDWAGDGWLRESVIESLKGEIWLMGKEEQ